MPSSGEGKLVIDTTASVVVFTWFTLIIGLVSDKPHPSEPCKRTKKNKRARHILESNEKKVIEKKEKKKKKVLISVSCLVFWLDDETTKFLRPVLITSKLDGLGGQGEQVTEALGEDERLRDGELDGFTKLCRVGSSHDDRRDRGIECGRERLPSTVCDGSVGIEDVIKVLVDLADGV